MKNSFARYAVVVVVAALFIFNSTSALAEDEDAGKRAGAAEAYDRGTAAFLAGRYAESGRWFETAYRLVPAYPSLAQALRAYAQVGDSLHAANIALRIHDLYADQPGAIEVSKPLLDRATEQYARVNFVCTDCNVSLDGKLLEHNAMFVEPSKRYTFLFDFPTGQRSVEFEGRARETREIRVQAPPPPPPGDKSKDNGLLLNASGSEAVDKTKFLPPWAVYTAAGVTVALVGAAVWSGLNAKAGVDAYESNPTQQALEDGQSKEQRTNILIGAAAGAAVITGVAAVFFTDWSSGKKDKPNKSVQATPILSTQQVGLTLTRSF